MQVDHGLLARETSSVLYMHLNNSYIHSLHECNNKLLHLYSPGECCFCSRLKSIFFSLSIDIMLV